MGRGLLKRLRLAGRKVQAYDSSESGRRAAREGGAVLAETAAEAARGTPCIHVIVPADEHVLNVMLGADGVIAGAEIGALVLLHSTILPATTQEVAERAREHGVDVIDAPVTAVPAKFEIGEGQFLMGGPETLVQKARGYLQPIGKSFHHFGPLGAGNVAKIAKALINASERVAFNEVLQIAEAGGLDVRQFLEFERATALEPAAKRWEQVFTVENNHAHPRPMTNLFNKDIFLAAKLAEIYALDAPVTQSTAQTATRWLRVWAEDAAK
jgi:3-hydroxyisobutyrate dehydrogenase-like beta-hydroxyacid dehydrogenase